MCGIVGFWQTRDSNWTAEHLTAARDAMQHRGPDDAGLWLEPDRSVGLAQRRLSIIDLSPGGHQPMLDTSGHLVIVFNGEIYNFLELRSDLETRGFRFRSSSDTEVMLAAYLHWGDDFLKKLEGMFAFALYDRRKHRMLLGRDRAGEKPLFYSLTNHGLLFASELKALMRFPGFPRRLDPEGLQSYLGYGYTIKDQCLLKDARKLPAGHAMVFSPEGQQTWSYWQLPEFTPSSLSTDETVDRLEQLLKASVRRQLVADVPVGILLSGGVDSSLVTAIAARTSSRPVKTYTISFPESRELNEASHARLIAHHFATEHTELEGTTATPDLLWKLARQFDEPICDSSLIPTFLVAQLVRQHCTVALGGDGGDELFGGYPRYDFLAGLGSFGQNLPRFLAFGLAKVAERLLPVGFKGRNFLMGFPARCGLVPEPPPLLFDQTARLRLLGLVRTRAMAEMAGIPEQQRNALTRFFSSPLRKLTGLDFQTYLCDDILVKVDRTSMLNSLEVRAPFLDVNLIEFAFGQVPDHLKNTGTDRKILLKLLARRILPAAFDFQRKQGFSIPLQQWLSGHWGKAFREILMELPADLFSQTAVHALIADLDKGRAVSERLFALVMFDLWRREYAIDCSDLY